MIMETLTYQHLRRVETNSQGRESLRMKQSRFTRLIALLILFAERNGYELTLGDAMARDGHMPGSLHYKRLAFDLNLFREGKYLTKTDDYKPLGHFWESIGGSWGGRFQDGNHFSLEHKGKR